eukprot:scaffold42588_cov63-Phaeocystis_antarctica.AAC.1
MLALTPALSPNPNPNPDQMRPADANPNPNPNLALTLTLTLTRCGQQMPREAAETVRIQLAAVTAAVAVHCQHSDAADEAHHP